MGIFHVNSDMIQLKTVARGIGRIKGGESARCAKIFKDTCVISVNNEKIMQRQTAEGGAQFGMR